MKDLLDYIVKNLVSNPDKVKIIEEMGEEELNLNLTVAADDMGIIIGKSGQTIRAIRKLLVARAMAENSHLRVNLNLQDAEKIS